MYILILIGMAAGIVIGLAALWLNGVAFVNDWIVPWGQLFIRLLQLIAVPLIFVSLVRGVISLKSIKSFSRMGLRTIILYLGTTFIAVIIGLSLGLLVKPGNIVDRSHVTHLQEDYVAAVQDKALAAGEASDKGPLNFLNEIVPNNIISAASENTRMLQVIFFAIFFGIAALSIPKEKTKTVSDFFEGLNHIILKMVDYIIMCAPIGVAALMAGLVTAFGGNVSIFTALGAYALTVAAGLFIIILFIYPTLVRLFTKMPPGTFLKKIYPVQLFAFTTSSSAATLPYTMDTVEKELGVSEETAQFVLPLGATINMDGTSCYQAIGILFIAQVLGIDLSLSQILVVVGMTILSSIGTPSIPGGSYVIMTMVLTSVGIPPEGLALIIGIDRPLDMLRTAVNVTGDAAVAVIVDKKQDVPVDAREPV